MSNDKRWPISLANEVKTLHVCLGEMEFFWALNEKAMSQNVTEPLWIRIIRIETLFEQIMRHMMFRVELC